jgi:predicted amidophosphoribosyltransferase
MNRPSPQDAGRCPVCQARFRGASPCSRCGADLEPLLLLAAHAYALRQAARRALQSGNLPAAAALARTARSWHASPEATFLAVVSAAANLVAEGNDT